MENRYYGVDNNTLTPGWNANQSSFVPGSITEAQMGNQMYNGMGGLYGSKPDQFSMLNADSYDGMQTGNPGTRGWYDNSYLGDNGEQLTQKGYGGTVMGLGNMALAGYFGNKQLKAGEKAADREWEMANKNYALKSAFATEQMNKIHRDYATSIANNSGGGPTDFAGIQQNYQGGNSVKNLDGSTTSYSGNSMQEGKLGGVAPVPVQAAPASNSTFAQKSGVTPPVKKPAAVAKPKKLS